MRRKVQEVMYSRVYNCIVTVRTVCAHARVCVCRSARLVLSQVTVNHEDKEIITEQ